jgi:hypothetical protein
MPFSGNFRAEAADRFLGVLFRLNYFHPLHQPVVFVFFDAAKGSSQIHIMDKWALLSLVVPLDRNEE